MYGVSVIIATANGHMKVYIPIPFSSTHVDKRRKDVIFFPSSTTSSTYISFPPPPPYLRGKKQKKKKTNTRHMYIHTSWPSLRLDAFYISIDLISSFFFGVRCVLANPSYSFLLPPLFFFKKKHSIPTRFGLSFPKKNLGLKVANSHLSMDFFGFFFPKYFSFAIFPHLHL